MDECQQETTDPNQSKVNFANKLAKAIVEEIKQAKINYTTGLVAPPGGGAVTGNLNSITIT
ncbi:hypothetical protein [Flavobacterium covae]|nr:hypothetical protein [Flavobacterium covae]MCJ1809914.1 hypothetical protein [Flavobacterium covae]